MDYILLFNRLLALAQFVYRLFPLDGYGLIENFYLVYLIEQHVFLIQHGVERQCTLALYQRAVIGHTRYKLFRNIVQLTVELLIKIPRRYLFIR